MLKNLFFIFEFVITSFVLVCTFHGTISSKFERQLKFAEDFEISDSKFIKESEENSSINVSNETLFPILPGMKNTTEKVLAEMNITNVQDLQDVKPEDKESFVTQENVKDEPNTGSLAITEPSISANDPTYEDKNEEVSSQLSNDFFQVDEKIILPRNNCHSEIAIDKNNDIKLTIKFGQLQNNSYGKCCLTLRGSENSLLGVLISNVHLFRNDSQGEVLKVIIGDQYPAFVLKEFYGSKDYEPLLLTETHKVYIVLYYKVDYIPLNQNGTCFNLEVFTYQKYINKKHESNYNHLHYSKANEGNIYSNEETLY